MKAFATHSAQTGTPNAIRQKGSPSSFFGVQAKLSIGKSNDKFEKEADSVADQVVAKTQKKDAFFGGDSFFPPSPKPIVQRSPFEEVQKQEGEEEIQEKPLAESITPVVQLASNDEDETVQEKCAECETEENMVQKMPFEDVQQKEEEEVVQQKEDEEVQKKEEQEEVIQQKEEEEVVQQKEDLPPIQEKCADCEQEESIQQKESTPIQRKGAIEFPAIPEGVKEEKEKMDAEAAPQEAATEETPAEAPAEEGTAGEKPAATDLPVPEKEEKKEKESLPPIQSKLDPALQMKGEGSSGTAEIESSLHASKGGGSPMSPKTQQEMGSSFGADFSNVRIHTDSRAVQMNKDLGAHAFTNGSDVYFNQGKYDPDSSGGKHLLAHELTHTIQQGATSTSIQKFTAPEKKASPEGNPEKPSDGAAVEGKSNNKINNDDRVKDGGDLDEDEIKEKKDPPRGEVHSEKSSVQSEGVSSPEVDRGAEAVDKIEGQKAEMNDQLSAEAPAGEAEGEGGEQAENSNLGEADAAEQRSQAALQTANAVPIPDQPQPFKHPNVVAPKDSAGKDIPRQANIDTQVRGLGYIGEMLREKGYEMKKHAAEKTIQSHGLDASLETSRQDLALAKEGTQMTEDQNTERKEISEKSKKALDESKQRQQFVANEAPGLVAEANEGKSDSGALASDASSKASQSKSEIPDDPDARADAEQQSGEMDQTAQGAQSMDDAITQTGERATQYIADAEQASADNQQSETQIGETDSVIAQLDGRVAEMKGLNEQSQASIDNSAAGPDLIRQHSQKTAASGDELIAATIVMETELNALQDEYLAGMAAIESKEAAEERVKKEQEEKQQQEASPEELQLFSLAALPEEEQQAQIDTLPEEEKKGLLAALEKMISETPDDGTAETEGKRLEVKLSSGDNGPGDPRQDQISAVDQQRVTRLGGVLDIADQNMTFLSAEQQRMLAEKLVAESITDDIKNISVQQMAKGMLEGMINPMASLQGVVGGFEKTFSGVANIFNAEAWEKDPLGNLLQIAADISTGLAMVFSSILGIAGMITALMVALTIISWGTLSPITGPVIGWMGTVMTYAGWGAIIAGLLSVYFNSLAYIKNLNDAGTATTARELFGNTEQMKKNASDGFTGAMAVVEGVGAVKMGPVMKSGAFMKNVPKSPGAFAKQTLNGAKEGLSAVAKLPARAAAGAKKLFAGGKQGLVAFKKKISGFLKRTDAPDAPKTPGSKKQRQDVLDANKSKKLEEMTPEQRRIDLEETANGTPKAIDPDSPHFKTHDVEISSNGHTYRRRRDGKGWCRFSAKECGIGEAELPDDVRRWLDENDDMLRQHGTFDDTPENRKKAQQDAERDIADSEGGSKKDVEEAPAAEPAVQHPPDNPNHTKRQKDFEAEIRKKVENGDITPDEAQGLRDFNEANKSGARDVDAVLADVRNPDLELNPATGRYKNKNGSGGLEIDDATRKKTEANRKREGRNDTPAEGSPEHAKLAEQKKATQQKVKDAEAEIDSYNDPTNNSPEAVAHRKAKAESFEKRNPRAESESKFNKEYDDINGGDPSDPKYVKEREDAFKEHRERERVQHSERYDRGRKNNKAGGAFEETRTAQRNAELEEQLGRKLKEGEGVRQRTPAEKIEFELDGEKIKVSPDLEDAGPPISYIESKSGKISLTPEVEDQIIRYAKLAQKTGRKVTYELLDGASPAVLNAMKRYGVDFIDFSKL
ncbi:MAG: DUF4157 domain-containing protein [Bacteroidota bacterium]